MNEFFLVLVALIFLTFLIVLMTVMFGRVWCGWFCPQTVLTDFTGFFAKAHLKGPVSAIASYLTVFFVSLTVAATLLWYFVSPYEFFGRLFAGSLGPVITAFWAVMTVTIFIDLAFIRQRFCATVCPYAKMQGVLFDKETLIIGFGPDRKDECMNCRACVKICPVDIDIREGLNAACIHCAECVDACAEMMGRKQKKSLINYAFGLPGSRPVLLRQNVMVIGLFTLVFFVFLLYLSFTRDRIDMTVLPNFDFPPRITTDGKPVNSYLLSFENRGKTDSTLRLRAEHTAGELRIIPEVIQLRAGEYRKIPAYVTASGFEDKRGMQDILIHIETAAPDRITIREHANFIIPER